MAFNPLSLKNQPRRVHFRCAPQQQIRHHFAAAATHRPTDVPVTSIEQ